jgi:hypothetical protein
MAEELGLARRRASSAVRRPSADDLRDSALVEGLAECGEMLAESTVVGRSVAGELMRGIGIVLILPTLLLALAVAGGFAGRPLAPIAMWVGIGLFGYIAWQSWLGKAWRKRISRRGERLCTLEDTAAMRSALLAAPDKRP